MIIDIKKANGKFLVSFKGKKHQFNDYINKIMSIPEKQFDFERKCWCFDEKGIEKVKRLFDVEKEELKKDVVLNNEYAKTVVTDYENIGQMMKLKPYEYQKEAIKFCLDKKEALVVFPCGSGKTPIGIGVYLEARERGLIQGPGLIVVKASLKTQWKREVEKFSDLKATIIQTLKEKTASVQAKIRRRKNQLSKFQSEEKKKELEAEIAALEQEAERLFRGQFKDADLFILNYETLRDSKVRNELHKLKIEFIMADEVHQIKNRNSQRAKALYEFGDAKIKIGATATPIGKNPEDLFGIFKFVKPELFPKWGQFASMYIRYAGYGRVVGFKNLDHLRKKIAMNLIVKSKEEISKQLPSLVVIQRYCEFEPAQQAVHDEIMATLDELKEKEFNIRKNIQSEAEAKSNEELLKLEAMILAHQTFAQQLANSEELFQMSDSEMAKKFVTGSRSNKVEMLVDLVEEILDSGEKVAIFSRFKKMQDVLTDRFEKAFPGVKIAYVHGGLNHKERYKEVYEKFQEKDEYRILLMSDAGAEGINLSKCKYLIEMEPAESYQIQTQRHGRIERADSIHNTVFVYQLLCANSWDEIAMKIVEKKENFDAELIRGEVE